jgi:glycosyltransferase involved in cell wall biosynthesis
MRILFITQFFHPEPSLKGMPFALELMKLGHEVEVLTGFPNYPSGTIYPGYKIRIMQRETLDGVSIIRVPLYPSHDHSALKRIANYVSFALSAAIIGPLTVKKPDVIYVYHPPPTVALPAIIIGLMRRAPFLYDIQDLWPDTLLATGMVRSSRILAMVGSLCRYIYRRAAKIVVLSDGFKQQIVTKGIPEAKVSVIHNWCDESQLSYSTLDPMEAALLEGKFNIIFAGNMGKAQNLGIVLQAARTIQDKHPNVQFVFVGGGLERSNLEEQRDQAKLKNVCFLPWRSAEKVGSLLQKADALLVYLKKNPLFEITIPSKVQAYLAAGRPILVGVPGDASRLVESAKAGLSFEPDQWTALVEAVDRLLALSPEDRAQMGLNGLAYYRSQLSLKIGTGRFSSLFAVMRGVSEPRPVK